MFDEKGPATGIDVLTHGIVDLFVSPFVFVIKYMVAAIVLPFRFMYHFFDPTTP